MRNYLKKNKAIMISSFILTIALAFMISLDRPSGTVGVEIFFIPLWILFWVCRYIDDKKER